VRAFVTGSRAYGIPRNHYTAIGYARSDLDLVVCVTSDEMSKLFEEAYLTGDVAGSGGPEDCSLRFGNLNLICTTDPERYRIWWEGTQELLEMAPVSRTVAVNTFSRIVGESEARKSAAAKAAEKLGSDIKFYRDMGMSVEVPLLKIVAFENSVELWPQEFRSLVAELHKNPDEKTTWGVTADWLEEHGESELAQAFRWVGRRPHLKVKHQAGVWLFVNMPSSVYANWSAKHANTTIPALMANLYEALKKTQEDLE
jgi:uncharacterized protein (TIGR02996 family)